MSFGTLLPDLRVPPPGPRSREAAERLRAVESHDVTYVDEGWPIFWTEARGGNVRDLDGNIFLDLTGAFGVGLLGHAPEAVVSAVERQAGRLLHGMGDIHPPRIKLELLERLAAVSPWSETRTVLSSTGSEAVETALKTAQVVTGRAGIVAFEGAYHGLTLGALAATDRDHFRSRFLDRMYGGVRFLPFPERNGEPDATAVLEEVAKALEEGAPNGDPIGAVLVEPMQGRGGARVPPDGFMAELSKLSRRAGALVIADEVFTGSGRCGGMFAAPTVGLEPDLLCLGKALGGGVPISACLGRAEVMDRWPESSGEAIHTSTFLGHPLGCAAALAVLDAHQREAIGERVVAAGRDWTDRLRHRLAGLPRVRDVRGLGLLIGIELGDPRDRSDGAGDGARVARALLSSGVLALPAGPEGNVVELTPSVHLTERQVGLGVEAVATAIEGLS
ncbi:MAG: aspartate aminotransferase family protein [Gemmatimonadota bacterium]|nr:aspartate aminotransferase family protein [Gemmatimonadota bacterium]